MSKMISRRVFLKATGLAVLSAAAAGALAGCGGGGAPSTASPTMDGSKQQGMGDIYVNMGSFVPMTFNNDYYKYTFLYIDNKANNTSFELKLSDFTCTVDGSPAYVCSLDNIEKMARCSLLIPFLSPPEQSPPAFLSISVSRLSSIGTTIELSLSSLLQAKTKKRPSPTKPLPFTRISLLKKYKEIPGRKGLVPSSAGDIFVMQVLQRTR